MVKILIHETIEYVLITEYNLNLQAAHEAAVSTLAPAPSEGAILDTLLQPGLTLLDIGTATGQFLVNLAERNPKAEKLVGIDSGLGEEGKEFKIGEVQIELRGVDVHAENWVSLIESGHYDIVTVLYPDNAHIDHLMSLFTVAVRAIKLQGIIYVVVDSEYGAEKAALLMSALFTNVHILPLPKDWPLSEYPRSEERRVGKECRSRWSPYH